MVLGCVCKNGYGCLVSVQLVGGWLWVTADKSTTTPASLSCHPVTVPDVTGSTASPYDGQDDWNVKQYLRSVLIQVNTDIFSLTMNTLQLLTDISADTGHL